MSELAKSHMSPVLPVIQEVCRQPEVMNGVVITYRICGELMRNCGCQAEQNRHMSAWKMEGKRRRNRTASLPPDEANHHLHERPSILTQLRTLSLSKDLVKMSAAMESVGTK
jgi:hypothetical protein